ncbi:hypothetical protein [Streptococcus anginosus]|uniref:hypothetical protein n=1 Tax=Streptococcus anginosus TaxID=1328 RepID=UPI001246C937|nr:hypothetical protein [Streptococcus anginosus]
MPPSFIVELGISLPNLLSKNQTGFSALTENFFKNKGFLLNAQETFFDEQIFFLSGGKIYLNPT